jgi:FAD/FMN-containing dehydrogenase
MGDLAKPSPNATSVGTVNELRSRMQGQVLLPDDAGYDGFRRGFNLAVDPHPAMIALPETAADIAEVARFASASGLDIGVMATGHGTVTPADDCLLINTSQMTGVSIDQQAQTARIEAGAKWGHVLPLAQDAGLAPLLGSSPDVGAVGYTLGGGFGWLGRKYGLSADSVIDFEVVTVDGQVLHASSTENSDLYWGLRGGGGSLAIVAAMTVKLYPVTSVYGGNLVYPMEMAPEIFRRYREWIKEVPDEMTSSVVLMNVPPLPVAPEFLRGKSVVFVRGCYCGAIEEGQALIDSWRQWREPMIDMFGEMPFSNAAQISSDPEDPLPSTYSGAWLRDLSDVAIEALVSAMTPAGGPPPIIMSEIRHVGGAIARVDPAEAAYGNRQEELLLFFTGLTPTPEAQQGFAHVRDQLKQALAPALSGRVYINFLEGSESAERVQDAFSDDAYQRLVQLKARYDAANRLNRGVHILPGS